MGVPGFAPEKNFKMCVYCVKDIYLAHYLIFALETKNFGGRH